jgi:transcriptional regulator with XRE-family HTH domain
MSIKLNRKGLDLLLTYYPKTQLAELFGISRPTMRKLASGDEPQSIAVVEHINAQIKKMLTRSKKL